MSNIPQPPAGPEQPSGPGQPPQYQPAGQPPQYQQPGQEGQFGQPQGQYGQPQGQYGQPQGQYGQPQGQYGQPQGQYGQPQGQYGQPQYGAPAGPKVSPLAIVSIVTGGLALLLCWLPFLAWPLGVVAIVCGAIALGKKLGGKGLSITGIVLGALGAIAATTFFFVVMAMVSSVEQSTGKSLGELQTAIASASAAAEKEHTVQYKVTTNTGVDVVYQDANGSMSEEITADWTKEYTDKGFVIGSVSVSAGNDDAAKITCEILIDGKSVSKKSESGAYASAFCMGSAED